LFLITCSSAVAVLFIFTFIIWDALPFLLEYGTRGDLVTDKSLGGYLSFAMDRLQEFFFSSRWYPSREQPEFGALAIFAGTALVTLGAVLIAVPLGVSASVCLSDVLPFSLRQAVKPVIEILAAIPSVAYGFFALVVFSPFLEQRGGTILSAAAWLLGAPLSLIGVAILGDLVAELRSGKAGRVAGPVLGCLFAALAGFELWDIWGHFTALRAAGTSGTWVALTAVAGGAVCLLTGAVAADLVTGRLLARSRAVASVLVAVALGQLAFWGLWHLGSSLAALRVSSGANALNAAVILSIMALPTVVSVSEDALQAVGRELREGSYALGATRAETLVKVVIPAASSGILAAVILGVMRAVGETMVVWMAAGNAAQIPDPPYNLLQPVRTLTANIAGDMGEADHSTGSARFHVLFLMALCLLVFSFACNLVSEWVVRRARRKLKGA
jgi:ABC-type phosphate transport system permease subunit